MSLPNSLSLMEPSMNMPLPKLSCAWAMVLFSPGTTRCFSKPKALQSQSIAAGALRYRKPGMMVEPVEGLAFADVAMGFSLRGKRVEFDSATQSDDNPRKFHKKGKA